MCLHYYSLKVEKELFARLQLHLGNGARRYCSGMDGSEKRSNVAHCSSQSSPHIGRKTDKEHAKPTRGCAFRFILDRVLREGRSFLIS